MSASQDRIAAACRRGGLDLVHPLSLSWLDAAILDDLPGGRPEALALLVGNTKTLWPYIQRARRGTDPVERWCEQVVRDAVQGLDAAIFHAHRRYDGVYLPFQRIAHQAGMLHLSPSRLGLHPTHGPWVALRSLIVLDEPGPDKTVEPAPDPCTPCDKPCLAAMEIALAGEHDEGAWRRWLAVRDACPVGRESRYGEAQIAYHYTKDPMWLDPAPLEDGGGEP